MGTVKQPLLLTSGQSHSHSQLHMDSQTDTLSYMGTVKQPLSAAWGQSNSHSQLRGDSQTAILIYMGTVKQALSATLGQLNRHSQIHGQGYLYRFGCGGGHRPDGGGFTHDSRRLLKDLNS